MADYSSDSNKSIISKKKKENSTGQNPFQTSSYSENPFVSANQGNPFETNNGNSNPFISSNNTSVIQQKTIQKNPDLERRNAVKSLPQKAESNVPKTRARSNAVTSRPQTPVSGLPKTRARSNAISIPNGPNATALSGMEGDTSTATNGEPHPFETLEEGVDILSSDNLGLSGDIADVASIAGGIFSMANGIKGLMDPDADGFDKAMSSLELVSGAVGIVKTVADVAEAGKDMPIIGPIIGIVNSSLGMIKHGIKIVQHIKKLKDGVEEGTKAEEALVLSGEIIQVGLDIASIAKNVYDVVGTTAPGALEAAVPGLGIVMATIDIIRQGVEIAKAVQNYRTMSGFKDELKTQVKNDYSDVLTSDKSGTFGKFRSNDRTVEPNLTNAMNQETGDPANAGATANGKTSAREFALARELKKVNRKRIIRGAVNISADALMIAGDIATLSGVGASAGVGLKVGAAGVKIGSKLARFAKQKYRNSGRGDQSKTSDAKHAKRVTNIKFIFQMIKNLQPSDPEKETKAIRIKTYIEATGTGFKNFIKYKANPQAAAKLLYSAMKKREAGDKVSAK